MRIWSEMTVQQRAEHLLKCGVIAELDMDTKLLELGYAAHVAGVGKLPIGIFQTEAEAVKAGTEWLEEKARGTPNLRQNDGEAA